MLEPPTPAGEPFGTQDEENRTSSDFETVCVSLVERGWKIMPKKGTYPYNKKGPRYVNLVDPRGNRKSIRVVDEALWEKLRAAETRRTQRKDEALDTPKIEEASVAQSEEMKLQEPVPSTLEVPATVADISETSSQTSTAEELQEIVVPLVSVSEVVTPLEVSNEVTVEQISIETSVPTIQETAPAAIQVETVTAPDLAAESVPKAEIVDNPPKEFQSFALSSPGLQKSIFDLGFETLLNVLQKETLSPAEIVSKIQEWSLGSKNLLEFVHKSLEKSEQPLALPDTTEKDELITELQSTLKETEDKLAEIMKSSREI